MKVPFSITFHGYVETDDWEDMPMKDIALELEKTSSVESRYARLSLDRGELNWEPEDDCGEAECPVHHRGAAPYCLLIEARLVGPTKEDIADYKAYHAGEGIHTP